MRKRVILTLIEGSFEQGFPVILRIREGSTLHETEALGRLPPALNILRVFNNWQSAYDQWQSTYRIKPNPGQVTNFSCREIASLGSQLAECLNEWLNSDSREWQKIRDQLQRSLSETDEIQFIIQTEDIRLRQLPWHLWDLFSEHYTKAEIALSAPQYRPPPPPNPTNKVKILAILGDSTGINVEQDKAILQKELPDAEIKFLTQPELKPLNDSLWEQQWDILFFAGHSASQADGSTGQIYINQDDSLSLRDLRNALRKAIFRGLQLAIFNSCDGLGLAQELADLNIPQIIVMRKPVPDKVAQEFLRHFLKVFASGKSLYLAVREARERLQGLEKQFPCASWLPVICQNPTKEPLTWQGLHPRSIRQRWLLPLQQAIVFLLPILILFRAEPETNYETLGVALDANSGREVYFHPNPDPNNPNHLWKLEEVGDNEVMILNEVKDTGIVEALDANYGWVMDVRQKLRQMGALYMYEKPNPRNGNQRWTLTKVGNYYMIVNRNIGGFGVSTKALDANGGRNTPYLNSNVERNNYNLHWKLTKIGEYYMLTPRVVHNLANGTLEENRPQTASNEEAKAKINRIYREILGRDAEPAAIAGRTNDLAKGMILSEIRRQTASSEEAKGQINLIYREVLGRDAEPAAIAGRVNDLAKGMTLSEIRRQTASSKEAKGQINLIYREVLGRDVEPAAIARRTNDLAKGMTLSEIRRQNASSKEAKNKINSIYREVLGRDAELYELKSHVDLLAEGVTSSLIRAGIARTSSLLQNGNVISLECLGHLSGSKFLDGRAGNRPVALTAFIDGQSTGTKWRIHVINDGVIALENQGKIPGSTWLNGLTYTETVNLAPNTQHPHTGTKWRIHIISDGVIALENQGHIAGSTWLNGETPKGKVNLVSYPNTSFTGTKWRVIKQ